MILPYICTYLAKEPPASMSLQLVPYKKNHVGPVVVIDVHRIGFIEAENISQALKSNKLVQRTIWLTFGDHIQRHNKLNRNHNLYRAVAPRDKKKISVVDLCCGFARDAALLHYWGFSVTIIEKNPAIVYALSNSAIMVNFLAGNCLSFIEALSISNDVFYLDPLYQIERNAKPRRSAMMIQSLCSSQENITAEELYASCAKTKISRIVLKRPIKAKPIAKPTFSLSGATTRYDVYQR